MFTGLVEGLAGVRSFERAGRGARLELAAPELERGLVRWKPVRGESIALSGCCLTISRIGRAGQTGYDLSAETLACTWLGRVRAGDALNVERAVRLADRLGGHLVAGHVDGLGRVLRSQDAADGGRVLTFQAAAGFERWLVQKGSVTVDGVSLTVVAPRGRTFRVALIPETLRKSTLGTVRVGDAVHLEADMVGKWLAHLSQPLRRGLGGASRTRRRRQPRAADKRRR